MSQTAQDLFHTFGCGFVAQRAAQFIGELEIKESLTKLAHEICQAAPEDNDWVLERAGGKLRIVGVENSEETFRSMSAAEIAGLDASGIYPAKLRDAIELLEEFSFFKL